MPTGLKIPTALPKYLPLLEECLGAINLGDGFLITGPDEDESDEEI